MLDVYIPTILQFGMFTFNSSSMADIRLLIPLGLALAVVAEY